MEYINADFSPIRAIVMSELGNRDKGVYYNLLATNDATFTRDSQGRIIANVRLLAANVVTNRQKKIANSEQKSGEYIFVSYFLSPTIFRGCLPLCFPVITITYRLFLCELGPSYKHVAI